MSVFDYFSDHWGMLVLILGMTIALTSEIHLEKRMVNRIAATNVMLLLYSVACYIETYLGNQENFSILRPVLSAVCYSLIAFILVNIVIKLYFANMKYLSSVSCDSQRSTVFHFNTDRYSFHHR